MLRGLNPKKYSSEENVLIYAGISCWVAEKRGRQDEHNNMLRTSSPSGALSLNGPLPGGQM